MALLEMDYSSEALKCVVSVNIMLSEIAKNSPEVGVFDVKKYKMLYLFHRWNWWDLHIQDGLKCLLEE